MGGGCFIRVGVLWILFNHRVNCLVNMESRLEYHDLKVCLNVFIRPPFLFQSLLCYRLFPEKGKLRVLNFGRPFNRGKDMSKARIGTTKGWPRLLSRGGRLTGIYLQYFTDNYYFETSITGSLIRFGRFIEVLLYISWRDESLLHSWPVLSVLFKHPSLSR